MTPPTTNTTGLTYTDANGNGIKKPLELLRSVKDGNLQTVFDYLQAAMRDFNRGNPVTFNAALMKLRHAHTVFAMLDTLCSEMGTLIDSNPGSLVKSTNTIGNATAKRTWP